LQVTEPVGIVDVRVGKVINVYLNGVPLAQSGNWWIDPQTLNQLWFVAAPGAGVVVTMDFSFLYFCRFIDDKLSLKEFYKGYWSLDSIKFRQTRPDPPAPVVGQTNTYVLPGADPPVITPQSGRFRIFEIQVVNTGNSGFGGGDFSVCAGLGHIGCQLDNPWSLDINSNGPTLADMVFWSFISGGAVQSPGWSYPTRASPGPTCQLGDWITFCADLPNEKVWLLNATLGSGAWFGVAGAGTPDPSTGTQGFTFGSGGLGPIGSPVHILGGCGRDGTRPQAELNLNSTGPFVGATWLPAGSHPWGGTWDTGQASAHLNISGNNIIAGTIPGSNQPTAMCLSTTSYTHP
jgi:hypothetical protein